MTYYEAAAKWWANKITTIIGANKMADSQATDLFEKKLADEIKKYVSGNEGLTLECSLVPDRILGNIARETRVDVMDLPWKTVMDITSEKVEVRCGYNSERVTIFPDCSEEV